MGGPARRSGGELRATWASLLIEIDGAVVTAVADQGARSTRSRINLPLYPLAEWLASNWWCLQYECESPQRKSHGRYWQRHNLRYGREGFAFPDLLIVPTGGRFDVRWEPPPDQAAGVRFLRSGQAFVDSAELIGQLQSFVSTVVRRLELEGIGGTVLQAEWAAIQGVDAEELEFCRAASLLGLDPYSATEEQAGRILSAHERLPGELLDDYFSAVDPEAIEAEFGVSPFVIRHQIENHNIATVID